MNWSVRVLGLGSFSLRVLCWGMRDFVVKDCMWADGWMKLFWCFAFWFDGCCGFLFYRGSLVLDWERYIAMNLQE